MANSRSARKRIRVNERKHIRNRAIRSAVRTKVAKARRALVGIEESLETQEQVLTAISALDKASEKGVLHHRNAARRKSRLMAMAHAIAVATAAGDDALAAARITALGGEKGRKAAAGTRAKAAAAPAVRTAAPAAAPAPTAAKAPAKAPVKARAKAGDGAVKTPRAKKP